MSRPESQHTAELQQTTESQEKSQNLIDLEERALNFSSLLITSPSESERINSSFSSMFNGIKSIKYSEKKLFYIFFSRMLNKLLKYAKRNNIKEVAAEYLERIKRLEESPEKFFKANELMLAKIEEVLTAADSSDQKPIDQFAHGHLLETYITGFKNEILPLTEAECNLAISELNDLLIKFLDDTHPKAKILAGKHLKKTTPEKFITFLERTIFELNDLISKASTSNPPDFFEHNLRTRLITFQNCINTSKLPITKKIEFVKDLVRKLDDLIQRNPQGKITVAQNYRKNFVNKLLPKLLEKAPSDGSRTKLSPNKNTLAVRMNELRNFQKAAFAAAHGTTKAPTTQTLEIKVSQTPAPITMLPVGNLTKDIENLFGEIKKKINNGNFNLKELDADSSRLEQLINQSRQLTEDVQAVITVHQVDFKEWADTLEKTTPGAAKAQEISTSLAIGFTYLSSGTTTFQHPNGNTSKDANDVKDLKDVKQSAVPSIIIDPLWSNVAQQFCFLLNNVLSNAFSGKFNSEEETVSKALATALLTEGRSALQIYIPNQMKDIFKTFRTKSTTINAAPKELQSFSAHLDSEFKFEQQIIDSKPQQAQQPRIAAGFQSTEVKSEVKSEFKATSLQLPVADTKPKLKELSEEEVARVKKELPNSRIHQKEPLSSSQLLSELLQDSEAVKDADIKKLCYALLTTRLKNNPALFYIFLQYLCNSASNKEGLEFLRDSISIWRNIGLMQHKENFGVAMKLLDLEGAPEELTKAIHSNLITTRF